MTTDGLHLLQKKLATAPTTPGVYRMLGEGGKVLYVGKAKNLKNRLMSYIRAEGLSHRIRRMVFETRELVLVQTTTEAEALLLEINLIKSLKPRYNIIFRDDASYPSILITHDDTPCLRYHRGAKKKKGDYFGPYPNAGAVSMTIDLLERAFRLRTCKDSIFSHRTRPCLKYDIKRCSGPCVGKINKEGYDALVAQAKRFLKGQGDDVQKELQAAMQTFAEQERFEDAAVMRDRLKALASVTHNRTALTHALTDADVFALAQTGNQACVQAFFYRSGRHVGNQTFFPRGTEELEPPEVFRLFLTQYYATRPPAKQVMTSHEVAEQELIEETLKQEFDAAFEFLQPQRGDKKKIVEQAQRNAEATLARRLSETQSWQKQMTAFGAMLKLDKPVMRVECFDISNISGKNAVASMVVAGEEGMLKSDYRKFAIQTKDSPDDYAMMAETLERRYSKLLKNISSFPRKRESHKERDPHFHGDDNHEKFPDVILVDGGKGHLNTLVQVMQALGVLDSPLAESIRLTAIAKGEERDKGLETIFMWRNGVVHELPIPYNSPLIFVLQRIRDEAHRFAIGFHRQKRSKDIEKSALDGIPHIGPKRKKALLLHFGSADGVKGASVEDLMRVDGISKQRAEEIYGWFRG